MSVIEKIDKFITESKKKKKVLKESFVEEDLTNDIMDLLNSLDDSQLDAAQIILRDKILSSNFTAIDTLPDDDLDVVEPEPDIDDFDTIIDEPVYDDFADDDFDDLGSFYESKKRKSKKGKLLTNKD